jgi:hypothetical protein
VLTPEYHRRFAEHLIRLANITNNPKTAAALRVLAADHLVMTESGPPFARTPFQTDDQRAGR